MRKLKLLFIVLASVMMSCSSDDNNGGGTISEGTGGVEFLQGSWNLVDERFSEENIVESVIDDCKKKSKLVVTAEAFSYTGVTEDGEFNNETEEFEPNGECNTLPTFENSYMVEGSAIITSSFGGSPKVEKTFTATENSLRIIIKDVLGSESTEEFVVLRELVFEKAN